MVGGGSESFWASRRVGLPADLEAVALGSPMASLFFTPRSYGPSAGSRCRGELRDTKQAIAGELFQHSGCPYGNSQHLERKGGASGEKQGQRVGE